MAPPDGAAAAPPDTAVGITCCRPCVAALRRVPSGRARPLRSWVRSQHPGNDLRLQTVRCPTPVLLGRWVRTLGSELTDRMLIFGQRHLRHVLAEYVKHYNHRRPHRVLDLSPPRPPAAVIDLDQQRRIRRRPILGGLINEYERAA
ncbi:integrase core domain-containing protein [Micromonospora zamorensis]|nr:integrase core domain-containing protein [Micromonospora zamorensis]